MMQFIDDLRNLIIGREDDGRVERVEIDCSAWLTDYPQLTDYRLEVTAPNGLVYMPDVSMEGNILTWTIKQCDTATTGNGRYQVVATGSDGERKTSDHPKLYILPVMPGAASEEPPEPSQPWVDKVLEAAERAEAAADRAESAGGGGGSGGGGITQETDPTVPAWAKQPGKPTYTADEVGALAADAPVVRYAAQELTAEQQAQARANVGAQPAGDYALKTDIPEPYVLPTASATVKGGVKVGKGLEMDGEALEVVPEGEYELIEKITVDTEISLLSRSQEPDGKKYDFKKIYIDIKTPQGSEKKVGVVSLNSNPVVPIAYMTNQIETNANGAWGKVFAHIDVNVLRGYAACSINGESQLTWTNANLYMRGFGEIGITGIYYMQFFIISGKIPVGTVVEIWGVRANA